MKAFSELGIQSDSHAFRGEKINIRKLFNKQIEIHDYKIEQSKHNSDVCLTIQIRFNDEYHICFCGSKNLADLLNKVDKKDFPFTATIENESFGYTLK